MKRLANKKTRMETGFDQVLQEINVSTPYGKKKIKEIHPYFPGEENKLKYEFEKIEKMLHVVENSSADIEEFDQIFMGIKDITFTLQRSRSNVLSVVELYEVKCFLLLSEKLESLLLRLKDSIAPELMLCSATELLDILDPGKDRLGTFYIYDEFSPRLSELRKRKRALELSLRKEQNQKWRELELKHGLKVSSRNEIVISKADTSQKEQISFIKELELSEEDYMSMTFKLKMNDIMFQIQGEIEEINGAAEEEEFHIRETLSGHVSKYAEVLLKNTERIGEIDFILAKAMYAKKHGCVKPSITDLHIIDMKYGRHIPVQKILEEKGKKFCPISICLEDGVTCITGANMGGKTVSLKLVGLVALMAQYGLYAPCESISVGLSSYIQILIGDSQSVQRGLSSFGGEMEELKEMLDNSKEKALILIDEIASGTNPVEGLALTKSLIAYLSRHPYITLLTTHYDHVASGTWTKTMQVRGLADADFEKLIRELRYANRRERIEIISKHMDYRLYQVDVSSETPRDALNIAKMLGIYDEIIDNAKKIIEEDAVHKGGKKYEEQIKS